MFGSIAKSLFGNANDRVIKAMTPLVQSINDREGDFAGGTRFIVWAAGLSGGEGQRMDA